MRTLFLCFTLLWLPVASAALDAGDAAPALKGTTLDGKAFDLAALKGKVVVLNQWATWCGPCREEMPVLDAFATQYAAHGVVVVGLDEDDPKDEAEVRKVMAAFHYPAVMAANTTTDDFHQPRVLPMTYVIDATGTIRSRLWPGSTPVTAASLEKAVTPLLGVKP
ncbi:MAG TPA: TlpA disulfide reductase family protein [Gammaproteobacteria bacterium]|jgi:thiol-disulfide isomerase/thioredoxin